MIKSTIALSVRKLNDQTSVIDIKGDVNAAADAALADAYAQASGHGIRTVILNFSGMDYMNSSGIGLLVTLLVRAQRQKQHLRACGLSEHYQEIFNLTRLNEAIGIFADEVAAAKSS